MTKNLYFDYCALMVLIIMGATLLIKKGYRGRTNRSFSILLITILYTTLYDICAVLLDNHGFGNVAFKYVMHSGYLALRNLIPVVYVMYVVTLTDTNHLFKNKKLLHGICHIPYITILILLLTAPFNKLAYYIDSDTLYQRGPLFFVLYLCAAFYMVYGLVYALLYMNQLTIQKFIPMFLVIPLQLISIIIQFIKPVYLLEMFFSSIAILFIMLTLQRPESMFDQVTGLLKTSIFTNTERLSCLNKKNIVIIFANIVNYKSFSSYYSFEKMSKVMYEYGRILVTGTEELDLEDAEIYYLGNGRYATILCESDILQTQKYAEILKDKTSKELHIGDINTVFPTNICITKVPEDFSVYEELLAFQKDITKLKYDKEIIYASDLLKKKDYQVIANMDSILETAIRDKAFEVYYQPIYSIREDRFNSAEALIRLKTEKFGFIRPDLFIPLAEESGLINQIDDIVFEEVCKFISSEDFHRLNIDYIEVNLSVVQCMQKNLAEKILNTMDKYGIYPSQINLEITETAAEYSQSTIDKNIETLKEAGISFSLDDFGTGYSNMVRIASLPLHIVKIDKSLACTEGRSELQVLLNNTVDMIKRINFKIVVEGIETEEMLNQFKILECDYIQGYYFSKPIPKKDFIDFIIKSGKNNAY